jgi:pyruvate,water dikinase
MQQFDAAMASLVRRFEEISIDDVPLVGGKNASVGEMYRELAPKGVQVPGGFAITAEAYRNFLREAGLDRAIPAILAGLDTRNVEDLRERGRQIRQAMVAATLPAELERAVLEAYERLGAGLAGPADVAVRSSATAEDLPEASFAGQQESYLNVQGTRALLDACRRCFASLYTDRAISYRVERGFDHSKVALSVGVQRMVRSDLGSAGVLFSIDTETGFPDVVLINAAWGLGESVVQGAVNPDEYLVFKPTLAQGYRPILRKRLGAKEVKVVYDEGGGRPVRTVRVPPDERARFALEDEEILTLARWGCLIEEHYSGKRGRPTPMDIEWAKDGRTGDLFVVQARPETVESRRPRTVLETYRLREHGPALVTGRSVGAKISQGPVRVIRDAARLSDLQPGEVLVAEKTDPDWEPVMKRAAAIVTDRGGRTCHAAIVSRELGLPAVVGTEVGTARLRDGVPVTVSCAEGETGAVYDGRLAFDIERVDLERLGRPRTRVMMNVANPDEALKLSAIPNDGAGLVRLEFIISSQIKVHPLALVGYERLDDPALRTEIDRLTAGYAGKSEFFVDRLAQGVGLLAAAFYPKDVIVRFSDFKSNEYAGLLGGSRYEPAEENPMLGFRGASRYYHPRYREGFALECQALRRVRDQMGLTNVKVMVPFCRTPDEGRRVLAEMAQHGLRQGEQGLEVYVMCEIPSNVLLAEAFADVFDGFSIGSNDLTQLTLGIDRDSEVVAPLFDERNPAVLELVARAIRAARARGRKIGLCGQAPSDYPEFARFLVQEGIDSISLNPDAVLRTTVAILEAEQAQGGASAGQPRRSAGQRDDVQPRRDGGPG